MLTSRIETLVQTRYAQPRRGGLLAAGGLALAGLAFLVLVLGMPNGFPANLAYGAETSQLAAAAAKLEDLPPAGPKVKAPTEDDVRGLAAATAEEGNRMRQRIRDAIAVSFDMPAPNSTRSRSMRMMGLLLLNADDAADRTELAFAFLVACHNLSDGPINPAAAMMGRHGALDPEAASDASLERYRLIAEKYGVRVN